MLFRVLVVGEDPFEDLLERTLDDGDVVVERSTPARFWSEPERRPFDLALIRRRDLPPDAVEAVARVRALHQRPEIAVWGSDLDGPDVLAMQAAGCFAVVPAGPGREPFAKALSKLVARRREAVAAVSRAREGPRASMDDLVCESPATRDVLRIAERVAVSDTSLLLLGETGVGKEWLARAVHGKSPRASGPFIAVNCGAIPEGLLESELFGHEKGAFTGAARTRRGYFEQAHGGTLFLDEIGDMPAQLQVRLLRVLQDHTLTRLGGEETIAVDTRVLAATHRDLKAAIVSGTFRQDLYYRLAVVTLTVPPLRDRAEDVPVLADLYLGRLARKLGRPEVVGFTEAARRAFAAYPWPGNVRELINVIERAVLLCDGERVDLRDLPREMTAGAQHAHDAADIHDLVQADLEKSFNLPLEIARQEILESFERRYIARLLDRHRGNIGKTAEQAGIDRRTLYNKMQRLGLRKGDFKGRSPS